MSSQPSPKAEPAAVEFRLPLQGGMEQLALRVLGEAIERGGVVAAIKVAVESSLAQRGLLTKEQAMAYLGAPSIRTLENWMKPATEGGRGLPHLKIGETVRFRLESLEAWAAQYEVNRVLPKVA